MDVPAAIETALEVEADHLARQRVAVFRDIGLVPPVIGQRTQLLHVTVNVLKNAAGRCAAPPRRACGFTTKTEGHGFGLFACASQVARMGGTLAAHGDGERRGATFTLTSVPRPPAGR